MVNARHRRCLIRAQWGEQFRENTTRRASDQRRANRASSRRSAPGTSRSKSPTSGTSQSGTCTCARRSTQDRRIDLRVMCLLECAREKRARPQLGAPHDPRQCHEDNRRSKPPPIAGTTSPLPSPKPRGRDPADCHRGTECTGNCGHFTSWTRGNRDSDRAALRMREPRTSPARRSSARSTRQGGAVRS